MKKPAAPKRNILFSFLSMTVLAVMLSALPASAQVAGCDPAVMENMRDKAKLKVAIDVAVAEEFIKQPASVVFMTCFAQQARISAQQGGNIFSGDFTEGLAPVINTSLKAHAQNYYNTDEYKDNAQIRALYDMTDIAAATGSDCTGLKILWDSVKKGPVNTSAPYMTMDDVVNGRIPNGAGETFKANMTSSSTKRLINNYKRSSNALRTPTATPNCSQHRNMCDFMQCVNNGTRPPGC